MMLAMERYRVERSDKIKLVNAASTIGDVHYFGQPSRVVRTRTSGWYRSMFQRVMLIFESAFLAASLYLGLLTYLYTGLKGPPTPEYQQYRASVEARLTTQPSWRAPSFTGYQFSPRPVSKLLLTISIACGVIGITLCVVDFRYARSAE